MLNSFNDEIGSMQHSCSTRGDKRGELIIHRLTERWNSINWQSWLQTHWRNKRSQIKSSVLHVLVIAVVGSYRPPQGNGGDYWIECGKKKSTTKDRQNERCWGRCDIYWPHIGDDVDRLQTEETFTLGYSRCLRGGIASSLIKDGVELSSPL